MVVAGSQVRNHISVYILDINFQFELRADCLSDLQRNSKLN